MLKVTDFNYEVFCTTFNGVPCWKYMGNDLGECIEFARRIKRNGEKFYDPLTQEVVGVHRATLNREMIRLLLAMSHYQEFNDFETMTYPDEFPVVSKAARGFTSDYNYLVHFGLLGKEKRDNDMHYWVTDKGREFLAGAKSPSALFNSGVEVHGFDPAGEMVSIDDFFTQKQQNEMKKPLWFLPQSYRQQILTPEELLIGLSAKELGLEE